MPCEWRDRTLGAAYCAYCGKLLLCFSEEEPSLPEARRPRFANISSPLTSSVVCFPASARAFSWWKAQPFSYSKETAPRASEVSSILTNMQVVDWITYWLLFSPLALLLIPDRLTTCVGGWMTPLIVRVGLVQPAQQNQGFNPLDWNGNMWLLSLWSCNQSRNLSSHNGILSQGGLCWICIPVFPWLKIVTCASAFWSLPSPLACGKENWMGWVTGLCHLFCSDRGADSARRGHFSSVLPASGHMKLETFRFGLLKLPVAGFDWCCN